MIKHNLLAMAKADGSFVDIVLIGGVKSGKTSFINQFINSVFEADYIPTQIVNSSEGLIVIDDNQVQITFFDVSGKELIDNTSKTFGTFTSNGPVHLVFISKENPGQLEKIKETFGYIGYPQSEKFHVKVLAFVVSFSDIQENNDLVEEVRKFAEESNSLFFTVNNKLHGGVKEIVSSVVTHYLSLDEIPRQLTKPTSKNSGNCVML